jgi:hypothetical protein
MRFVERGILTAPPDRVWPVVVDWERQPRWIPDVAWVRVDGPARELGARMRVRTKVFGVPAITDVVRVTGWEPPSLVAVRHEGLVRGTGEWRLDPIAGGGTQFIWTEELRLPVPILGDVALWSYRPWQRAMFRRAIRNLARLVRH